MKSKKPGLHSLPAGAGAGMFLRDAALQRAVASQLDAIYESWAYLPVHTPVVDYEEAYTRGLGVSLPPATYRLLDREGHVLALRSDITLFLVKQVHTLLLTAELPLRLCYTDSIVRYRDRIDIEKNEFYQSGAELIGASGRDADLEILCLFAEALRGSRCPYPAIHIGNAGIFAELFGNVDSTSSAMLRHSLTMRNWNLAEELAGGAGTGGARAEALATLFGLIATPAEFADRTSGLAKVAGSSSSGLRARLEELADRATAFQKLNPDMQVRVDLSELGTQTYHNGIVFRAYIDGSDSAVAAGGRYDGLLVREGTEIPALGFSVMVSKIIGKLESPRAESTIINLNSGDPFEKRLAEATRLRNEGRSVRL